MASITIRNLDATLEQRLRTRAAENGRSMEEEAQQILRQAVASQAAPRDLAASIRARVRALGGIDLEIAPRGAMREPPAFI
ncbi:FitA-like ribbon-helix-helix domain-containing protein [Rhodospirillum centenum]|uniref:Plasmid stability protein, putative n=1 Tax=Rhodospirillum centenum (strain ATCC 51521 / SW) TaxID=414684 RepID=B6IXN8_RHOCS|nr:plasmid stabilization protein [Rhodospirillum centenum]ACJ01062.1 plasmid stability protein, putative [Rhodospirillum centenum SW]